MSRRVLSEARTWREIARRLAEGESRMEYGLCAEALDVSGDYDLFYVMSDRCEPHAQLSPDRVHGGIMGYFAFPQGTHREERILAALWLALEAEDEARGAR